MIEESKWKWSDKLKKNKLKKNKGVKAVGSSGLDGGICD